MESSRTAGGNGELKRSIGLWTATGIVATSMIGTGIMTITGIMAADLQDPWWILGLWLLGGVIALTGALTFGELGAMYPRAGGSYVYIYHGYGPMWGFLSGWTSLFVGFSAPVAAGALASMEYLSTYYPVLSPLGGVSIPLGFFSLKVSWGHLAGALVIAWMSWMHYVGVRTGALLQNSMTTLKITVLAGIAIAGFLWGRGDWAHLKGARPAIDTISLLPKVGVSLIFVMFAYSGWDSSAYIAGEIKNPNRNLPLSLLMGTGGVLILYMSLNLLYLYALSIPEMSNVLAIGSVTLNALFGPQVTVWTDAILALSILSAVNAFILIGPRVYYAMAKDGIFMPLFAEVHPKFYTPAKAIVLQAIIAIMLMVTGTFDQLLAYAGFCLMLFSTMAVAAIYMLRWRQPDNPRPYRTWGYPVIPALFIMVGIWIMVYTFVGRPIESLLGIGTVLVGLPFFFRYWRKHGGVRKSEVCEDETENTSPHSEV